MGPYFVSYLLPNFNHVPLEPDFQREFNAKFSQLHFTSQAQKLWFLSFIKLQVFQQEIEIFLWTID